MTEATLLDVTEPRTPPFLGNAHSAKTVIGGTVGNVMEWYDFALYGFFAPVIAQLFFPSGDRLFSLIATFGVFAAGFVMRPIGGIVFGYVGDRLGRAAVLRISILTMGTATLLLGLLPTEAQLGAWSPVLLLTIRLLQGLSVGGEFSGSVTYMVETSPLHRRGFSGSWANVGSLVGTLVGSGFAALLTSELDSAAVAAWGWRVPFLAGGVFAMLAYLYVRRLGTTEHMIHHERQHEGDTPLHEALTVNRRETLLAVMFASGYGIFFYIPIVYLPTYAAEVGGLGNGAALEINSLGIALGVPLIPLFGWCSDYLLRRRTLLLIGFMLTAGCAWSLVALARENFAGLAAAQLLLAVLVAVPLGAAPAMMVELFPVADRLTAYSLAYNLGLGVAGGTAPMVATWLIAETGVDSAPGAYLAVGALLSAAALWFMQDRSREPLL